MVFRNSVLTTFKDSLQEQIPVTMVHRVCLSQQFDHVMCVKDNNLEYNFSDAEIVKRNTPKQ